MAYKLPTNNSTNWGATINAILTQFERRIQKIENADSIDANVIYSANGSGLTGDIKFNLSTTTDNENTIIMTEDLIITEGIFQFIPIPGRMESLFDASENNITIPKNTSTSVFTIKQVYLKVVVQSDGTYDYSVTLEDERVFDADHIKLGTRFSIENDCYFIKEVEGTYKSSFEKELTSTPRATIDNSILAPFGLSSDLKLTRSESSTKGSLYTIKANYLSDNDTYNFTIDMNNYGDKYLLDNNNGEGIIIPYVSKELPIDLATPDHEGYYGVFLNKLGIPFVAKSITQMGSNVTHIDAQNAVFNLSKKSLLMDNVLVFLYGIKNGEYVVTQSVDNGLAPSEVPAVKFRYGKYMGIDDIFFTNKTSAELSGIASPKGIFFKPTSELTRNEQFNLKVLGENGGSTDILTCYPGDITINKDDILFNPNVKFQNEIHFLNNSTNVAAELKSNELIFKNDALSRIMVLNKNGMDFYDESNPAYLKSQFGKDGVKIKTGYSNGGLDKILITEEGISLQNNATFDTSSDKRLKENFKESNIDYLDIIENTKLNFFNYKGVHKETLGLIAQELEQNLNENSNKFISTSDDGYLSIKENKLIYLLWGAIQSQQKQIDRLKEELSKSMKGE